MGLDLGTNSIGWAFIREIAGQDKRIISSGSRIIPMDAAMQSDFAKGNKVSQTADRTGYRGTRRLHERHLLRRERLHRVLAVMGFLPPHYLDSLTRYGKFRKDVECRLPWATGEGGLPVFIFRQSYDEMLRMFWEKHPELMRKNMKVPYDWTLYYLRKKALDEAVTGEELAWILLSFNQKRGYYQMRGEEEETDKAKQEKYYALKVTEVIDTGDVKGKDRW